MLPWQSAYHAKCVTAVQALQIVQSGYRVALGTGGAEPQTLVEALIEGRERLSDVRLLVQVLGSSCPYAKKEMGRHFRIVTTYSNPRLRDAMREGFGEVLPWHLSEMPRLLEEGYLPLDVALISVTPPDQNGYCCLSISVDYLKAAIACAKVVVAEVNDQLPRTFGDSLVHVSELDYLVESSRPPLSLPTSEPNPVEEAIGRHVASVIEDRATIQIGVGGVPSAVLAALHDRRDLGIHSGLISDNVMHLMEAGVVTGRYKPINRGKVVSTMAVGTERFYRFTRDNATIEMYPVTYTHNAAILAQLENFVSINSALEIDLTGQVNAETIAGIQIGGVGGQPDFMRAAARVPNGKAIIALPSTADGGKVPRIVPQLDAGTPVTTPRHDVRYVATEFGIVDLRGKTLNERAKALLGIAHPEFRDALAAAYSNLARRHQ